MDSHSKWLHLQRFLSEVSLDQESRLSLSCNSDSDDDVFKDHTHFTEKQHKRFHSGFAHFSNQTVDVFVKYKQNHGSRKGQRRDRHLTNNKGNHAISSSKSEVKNVTERRLEPTIKPHTLQLFNMEPVTKQPCDKALVSNTHETEPCSREMDPYSEIDDLTHLVGPLTESSIIKCLESRFSNHLYQTWIGPVLICLNGNQHISSPLALSESSHISQFLHDMVHRAVRNHEDTGHSQVIIASGESGSGKTHHTLQILGQLFDMAGGGRETDAFKHLQASITVLQSLGSAATLTNQDSSRVGYLIENFISDTALYRTKIHCYMIERDRITNVQRNEKNYHIFYQILAGLSHEEKVKMHLTGYSPHNLNYLSSGNVQQNEAVDRQRFEAWKKSLSVLGIPFSDVMRVMSAVLLLGNIRFIQGSGLELDLAGNNEIKAVAALLGVSGVSLYRGFTTKTRNVKGQMCKSFADVNSANKTRDSLAKALYCRTMMAVLRRANSMRRLSSTQSCDSLNSSHETVGFTSLYHQLSHTSTHTHGSQHGSFISILDMFGFEVSETNRLEQLCINLCAETMQHFYNTLIFKRTQDALKEEGLQAELEVSFSDNQSVLELLSAQRTGIFSILESSCSHPKSSPETVVANLKSHHRINSHFFEPLPKDDISFGIRHFAGRVVYDASLFVRSNQDQLSDDIVCVFARQSCNFGFVSHLFTQEMKMTSSSGIGAKGHKYRILPYSSPDHSVICSEGQGSMCQDFQSRLDKLLRILMHAQPHFIRCLKANDQGEVGVFDKEVVIRQLRSLQVLETVHLMAGGVPHKMRFKAFKNRYWIFLKQKQALKNDSSIEDCKMILDKFLKAMDESRLPYVSTQWLLGKKYIFFSEGTRQHLEAMRQEFYNRHAAVIQASWRGYSSRKHWPVLKEQLMNMRQRMVLQQIGQIQNRNSGVENKLSHDLNGRELLQKAAKMYNIDLNNIPSIPPSRAYTVKDLVKIEYPQVRVLKEDYPSSAQIGSKFHCGQEVKVIGASPRRGFLIVQRNNVTHHVPYSLLDLKTVPALSDEQKGMSV